MTLFIHSFCPHIFSISISSSPQHVVKAQGLRYKYILNARKNVHKKQWRSFCHSLMRNEWEWHDTAVCLLWLLYCSNIISRTFTCARSKANWRILQWNSFSTIRVSRKKIVHCSLRWALLLMDGRRPKSVLMARCRVCVCLLDAFSYEM